MIVLVDDDATFRGLLAANLEDAGFRVQDFPGAAPALAWVAEGHRADAWVLDWRMPETDGPALLRALREAGVDAPVVFLTGHAEPVFEEHGLTLGAVDFVDKAKSAAIVVQRLKIALAGAKAAPVPEATTALAFDGARVVWRGHTVSLTPTEVRMVRLLAERAGRDVGYREIYDAARGQGFVAGSGADGYRTNVRAAIRRIRQKFRDIDGDFDAIEAYPGYGYRWRS
jgi:two-component system response regulator ChvI